MKELEARIIDGARARSTRATAAQALATDPLAIARLVQLAASDDASTVRVLAFGLGYAAGYPDDAHAAIDPWITLNAARPLTQSTDAQLAGAARQALDAAHEADDVVRRVETSASGSEARSIPTRGRYHPGFVLAEARSQLRRGRACPSAFTGTRMTTLQRLFSLLALTSVFACSSVDVEYAYGKASFSGFGSNFAWADKTEEGNVEVPADVLAFIHDTIERGLVGKGYVKAGAGAGADFLVSYRVSKKFAIAASSDNDLKHYEEGALDVFILTPKSSELMWQGTAHAAMDASLTPSERHERLREGVTKMLKNFPDAGKEAKR